MIRSLRPAAALAAAALATAGLASPIDGTWKADVAKAKLPARPDVYRLANGSYTCSSCVPAYTVAADGAFHAVAGHDYWDEASVTVVDATTVRYAFRQKGALMGSSTDTVSADGNTLTSTFNQTGTANGTAVTGTSTETRIAPAPAGAHAISGSWKQAAVSGLSDSGAVFTYRDMGDNLTLTLPTGESYTAKYGGAAVPLTGDKGGTMVTIRKTGPLTWVETGTRAGKPAYRMVMTVAPNGQSMTVDSTSSRTNATTSYTAYKQ